MRWLIAVLSVAWACPASAQWVHSKGEDNPFAGGSTQLAMSVGFSGFALAFRCTSTKDLSILLITPEKPRADQVAAIRSLPIEMLVIVDQQPKVAIDAEIDTTPDGDNYRVTAMGPNVVRLLNAAAEGSSRIAVAGQVGGKVIWTHSFGLSGSRRALQPLITGCKIERLPG